MTASQHSRRAPAADPLGGSGLDQLDLGLSERGRPLYDAVCDFVRDEIDPVTAEFYRLGEGRAERWSFAAGQLELLESVKDKARAAGLWNFFLSDADGGTGVSSLDYAHIAAELGRNPLASECFNASPPDSVNMEVLLRAGTDEQKRQWLQPLLDGRIRSAFAMSEPGVASSDATNIACRAVPDGGEWVLDGEKFYISGAGDPRCRLLICMALTSPDGPRHRRHTQFLVPMDAPGVEVVAPMEVFNDDHAPYGHMHLRLRSVRVPAASVLLGEGRGFEVAQMRLGPARIHHCMRSIGVAERALEMMAERGSSREAFGQPLARLGRNIEVIARARVEIEAMRLMVLRAAKAIDTLGAAEARLWVSAVKAMVPERVCRIIDDAIQLHGAAGLSQSTPLPRMYAGQRGLRIADGPDEVHWAVVGKAELAFHERRRAARDRPAGARSSS
ncbi:MAG TPA: acyl-CoA dehydrogenase family protein [Acidimicrobiales bacterium]|nr:acyl-CoA dehydrogenase family protein [Acidimicrobiales bacterium]